MADEGVVDSVNNIQYYQSPAYRQNLIARINGANPQDIVNGRDLIDELLDVAGVAGFSNFYRNVLLNRIYAKYPSLRPPPPPPPGGHLPDEGLGAGLFSKGVKMSKYDLHRDLSNTKLCPSQQREPNNNVINPVGGLLDYRPKAGDLQNIIDGFIKVLERQQTREDLSREFLRQLELLRRIKTQIEGGRGQVFFTRPFSGITLADRLLELGSHNARLRQAYDQRRAELGHE